MYKVYVSQRIIAIDNAINAINLTMERYGPLKLALITEVQVIDLRLRKKYTR